MSEGFVPTPRRRAAPFKAALLAVAAAAAAAPATAAFFNVSAVVTGGYQMTPLVLSSSPTYPCGTACQYVVTSSTGADDGYDMAPGPYAASAWPPVYGAALPAVGTVSEALALPAPPSGVDQLDGGSIGAARRAAVDYDWYPALGGTRRMSAQTWQGGSGASVVSIAVRITPSGANTYLEFTVPKTERGWKEAGYKAPYVDGGWIWKSKLPSQVQARSAVDVYVDGLPVWTGESNSLRPRRFDASDPDYLQLQWDGALDEDVVTLYLGKLPAGSTRTVALVFRTDLRVVAPTCYTGTDNGTVYQRCDSRREALSLPSVASSSGGLYGFVSYRPAVRVYTR
jgi:hypothetical protein